MTNERIIALTGIDGPDLNHMNSQTAYFDRTVQTNRGKTGTVLWIELYTHDVVGMTFESLYSSYRCRITYSY